MSTPNPGTTDWVPIWALQGNANAALYQLRSEKAQPSGYASLDAGGLVPVAQLPPGIGLPADTVVVAATRIISNKLLAGDAQPSWRIFGSGKMEWGPGGSTAIDTNLYRAAAGQLKTDNLIIAVQGYYAAPMAGATSLGYQSNVSGDAASRFAIQADGKMSWGPGNVGADTNLYRSAVGVLKTDGVLLSTNSIPTGGTTGQSLTKTSNADYAMGWTTVSGGAGLPADTVVVAGTRIISNKLLAGDAQPSWQVMGS